MPQKNTCLFYDLLQGVIEIIQREGTQDDYALAI